MARKIQSLWPLAVLVAACGVVFGPILQPDLTFGGMDFLNLLYPQALLVQRAYGSGTIPLWNWYEWGGCPLLAAMQSAPLYPPMWLTVAFPLPFALQANVFAHLVWAGCGGYILARLVFSCPPSAAIFGAMAYANSGFFLGHIEQVNSIAAMAWCPWIFLTGILFVRRQCRGLWFTITVTMALLAGHPQHVVLALLFLDFFLVMDWLLPNHQERSRKNATRILLLQCSLSFAGLVAAAQLLPTQELAGFSERIRPYPDPDEPALKWSYLAAMILPRFYNRLAGTEGVPLGYTELGLYAGVLTAALAIVGLFNATTHHRRTNLPLLLTWVVALLYALGRDGGIAPSLNRLITFLHHSRGTARSLNVETMLLCIIASAGFVAVLERIKSAKKAGLASVAAILTLLADLSVTHRPELLGLFVPAAVLGYESPLLKKASTEVNDSPRVYRFTSNDSDYYLDHRPSAILQRLNRLQPNLNIIPAVATTDGYEEGLLPTRHYANFLRRFNRNLRRDLPDGPLLALMGSRLILTEFPIAAKSSSLRPIEQLSSGNAPNLFLLDTGYPAGWFLDEAPFVPSRHYDWTLSNLASSSENGFEKTQTAETKHLLNQVTTATFQAAADSAALKALPDRTCNSLSATITDNSNGDTLFCQAWFPGWKVNSIPLDHVCTVLSRVPREATSAKPAGTVLKIHFSPFSFRLGLFISLISLGGLAWFAVAFRPAAGKPSVL
ncbi:MAG: hypothetical protein K1X53_00315 [Candidatus Sumerlaeaceae bacterium]|nr:hypothetical protein [Candidatus Sumerlaeaceae bacterium]